MLSDAFKLDFKLDSDKTATKEESDYKANERHLFHVLILSVAKPSFYKILKLSQMCICLFLKKIQYFHNLDTLPF